MSYRVSQTKVKTPHLQIIDVMINDFFDTFRYKVNMSFHSPSCPDKCLPFRISCRKSKIITEKDLNKNSVWYIKVNAPTKIHKIMPSSLRSRLHGSKIVHKLQNMNHVSYHLNIS